MVLPAATAVTMPAAETVAMAWLSDVQVAPVLGTVPPIAFTRWIGGVTVSLMLASVSAATWNFTVSGLFCTVMAEVEDTPVTRALIVALPAALPVTRPAASTFATFVSEDDQVKVNPE